MRIVRSSKRPEGFRRRARRIAEEHGLDISQIRGTGPDGSITSEDVLAAAAAPKPVPAATTAAPAMSAIARLMAERTTQSWTQTPHFFLVRELDAGGLIAARKDLGEGFTITDSTIPTASRACAHQATAECATWTGDVYPSQP